LHDLRSNESTKVFIVAASGNNAYQALVIVVIEIFSSSFFELRYQTLIDCEDWTSRISSGCINVVTNSYSGVLTSSLGHAFLESAIHFCHGILPRSRITNDSSHLSSHIILISIFNWANKVVIMSLWHRTVFSFSENSDTVIKSICWTSVPGWMNNCFEDFKLSAIVTLALPILVNSNVIVDLELASLSQIRITKTMSTCHDEFDIFAADIPV